MDFKRGEGVVAQACLVILNVYYERSAKRGASLLLYTGEKSV